MYYVGIDIAKLNHFASVISADGEVLIKPFKFTNDNDDFCKLLSALASYERGSLIIALESTVHYADNLVEFLVSKRYQVCVINPIQTSTMRKNFNFTAAQVLLTGGYRPHAPEESRPFPAEEHQRADPAYDPAHCLR